MREIDDTLLIIFRDSILYYGNNSHDPDCYRRLKLRMKISEIITDKYKLSIPPTVYYDLLADVREVEEEQEPTTKNDLGVDCISRETVKELISAQRLDTFDDEGREWANIKIEAILKGLEELPSVTPQEPQTFKWCTDCKEYDQEKHCCHRWSKVIRNTVEEMKQEQAPVLDKVRAEIEQIEINGHIRDVECFNMGIRYALNIIDKYKAESEKTDG